jgi:hypothetical protein
VDRVTIALVQRMNPTTLHHLDRRDIDADLLVIDDALRRKTADPFEVGFRPSPHRCQYCPARSACPRLHYDLDRAGEVMSQPRPDELILSFQTPDLSRFLRACESVETLQKTAAQEMERRLRAGETDAAYGLVEGRTMRKVVNAAALVSRLTEEGVPLPKALAAMSITVGNAETLLKDATGLKGKHLAARMKEIGEGCIVKPEPELKMGRIG